MWIEKSQNLEKDCSCAVTNLNLIETMDLRKTDACC